MMRKIRRFYMKSNQFLKAFSILFVLIFLMIGVIYIANPLLSSAVFSTSYQDFPDPIPMPENEPNHIVEVPGFIQAFDISADGKTIAIATSTDLILFDLQTLKEVHNMPLRERVFQVKFSPDGSKIAVSAIISKSLGSGPLRVTVWDAISWKNIYEYESESQGAVPEGALAWSPNNEQIAFSIPERGLAVMDVKSEKETASLKDFIVPPFDLSWSPDGSRLISTGDLGYGLRRWRVDADKWVRLWDAHLQPAQQVAWSPDGKWIASGHFGGDVCVWNARNNQCEGYIKAHFISVNALDWSPDSRQIATASGAIRVWDADTGEMSSAFGFYDGILYQELRWFDPQTIATLETSYTQYVPSTIRFWDISTGNVNLAFRGWDNIESANNGGVMLALDDIQISNERTVLQVSLRFDTPELTIAGLWNLTMVDSQSRIYPLTDITPETMDMGITRVYQTIPLPAGERITLDLTSFPQKERMPLMLDLSANPGRFTFNPSALQIGESMTLNEEIQANGYLLRLNGIRKTTANELLFEFDSEGYFSGVMLYSSAAGGSSTNIAKNGKITSSILFAEMPTEPIDIEVTRIHYDAFGPWSLEFQVAASTFTDLPEVAPALTPSPQPEPKFASQDPIFLEAKALTDKLNQSVVQEPGWVRVVSEIITENLQPGQTYPPPYYQDEQWFEIDSNARLDSARPGLRLGAW
jgi:WD40 repeat protein